uniref:MATH domain-containing protein n=1 Tax=Caenorhabditis tropicalis TaxID=1561998 RepID=A0A1I7U3K8_9PELO
MSMEFGSRTVHKKVVPEVTSSSSDPNKNYYFPARITTKYDEVTALFENNPRMFHAITFQFPYKFNWDIFSKSKMQYVVFTKICQSHPHGQLVEMRKEDTKCRDCGSSNLAICVRLTVPLDLSDVSFPCFEDIQIHVAFPIDQVLKISKKTSAENTQPLVDISRKNLKKMFNLFEEINRDRQSNQEYEKWFEDCKLLIKTSFESKKMQLYVGRVVRKKLEEINGNEKKDVLYSPAFSMSIKIFPA